MIRASPVQTASNDLGDQIRTLLISPASLLAAEILEPSLPHSQPPRLWLLAMRNRSAPDFWAGFNSSTDDHDYVFGAGELALRLSARHSILPGHWFKLPPILLSEIHWRSRIFDGA